MQQSERLKQELTVLQDQLNTEGMSAKQKQEVHERAMENLRKQAEEQHALARAQ